MWRAKYFGIYHKESSKVTHDDEHYESNDLNIEQFVISETSTNMVCSSLDNYANTSPDIGNRKYGCNCSIWVVRELINRTNGYKGPICNKNVKDLVTYRIQLFHLFMKLYDLISEKNTCIFQWKEKELANNKAVWQAIF